MMVAARYVKDRARIADTGRRGNHPRRRDLSASVDVINGVIKANIRSPDGVVGVHRWSNSWATLLDQAGAERLVGKGDVLLLTASSNVPRRLPGPVGVGEGSRREDVVEALACPGRRRPSRWSASRTSWRACPVGSRASMTTMTSSSTAAMDLVVRSQLGSTSMLQRKLRVGFARAGRLMDLLERRGVVGPSEGSKARQVLMTIDELDGLDHR